MFLLSSCVHGVRECTPPSCMASWVLLEASGGGAQLEEGVIGLTGRLCYTGHGNYCLQFESDLATCLSHFIPS